MLHVSVDFYINFFKDIFHVSDWVRVHVYVIISSSLKPYQNFRPDLSPACLLMFSVVVPTISKQTTGILSGHARRVSGHEA